MEKWFVIVTSSLTQIRDQLRCFKQANLNGKDNTSEKCKGLGKGGGDDSLATKGVKGGGGRGGIAGKEGGLSVADV
ncbi:hypothetical protein HAX54_049540, partial [Datura stramonium]|nr:hypothetical protein [Datura stramonium]